MDSQEIQVDKTSAERARTHTHTPFYREGLRKDRQARTSIEQAKTRQ